MLIPLLDIAALPQTADWPAAPNRLTLEPDGRELTPEEAQAALHAVMATLVRSLNGWRPARRDVA